MLPMLIDGGLSLLQQMKQLQIPEHFYKQDHKTV
jgi:hypothetical protein